MKSKKIAESTTNRGEFNRAYKYYLEHKGKIHCSYCGYNRGENNEDKWYGGHDINEIRYPNWKLVSKNPKQWMNKNIVIKTKYYNAYRSTTYNITW